MSIVTLLSDFGLQDGYVGAMKGVILSENKKLQVVDISHEIRPYQIHEAAYVLVNYYDKFPKGTVHVAVVDPGVGSSRKSIIVQTAKYFMVGPDNGLFSYILQQEAHTLWEIDSTRISDQIHATFHGRDLYAPVAAKLASGVAIEKLAHRFTDTPVLFRVGAVGDDDRINARIISIDHFGNIITDFSQVQFKTFSGLKFSQLKIADRVIDRMSRTYSDVEAGQLLCLWGSSGFLEISVNRGNAARQLGVTAGKHEVIIQLAE